MKAAIYSRVSTDNQEREGTSLQTQLENCLKHCQGKGYEVSYRFSEAYSGLSLERPELDKLRELIRAEAIDVVVCYSLDRLTRDPGHGVIITQELEKHHVTLEAVTEDVDNSELGKLISYIRGFASKLEAEKIRERTMRGKRARAKEGRIPCGGYDRLYGYDYIRVSQKNGGRRIINETEASWVRQMFQWLVNDGIATFAISQRLNSLNVASKYGRTWSRKTVWKILTNPAYMGKTLYTSNETIELAGVTPPIIDETLYKAAQRQLDINAAKAKRNTKRDYLLHGHVFCRQCGRPYWSHICVQHRKYGKYEYRRYVCSGTINTVASVSRCHNKGWQANTIETLVWNKLSRYLSDRDLIISQLEAQRQDAGQVNVFEAELERVQRQLKALDREQHQLLQWALKEFPADQVEAENKRLNKAKETLQAQKTDLEAQLKASQDAVINVPNLERFIADMQDKLPSLDFGGKRLALDMLGIKVWIDGEYAEVTGVIEPEIIVNALPQSASPPRRRPGRG